MSKRSSQTGCW
jgi:hypothetical protein